MSITDARATPPICIDGDRRVRCPVDVVVSYGEGSELRVPSLWIGGDGVTCWPCKYDPDLLMASYVHDYFLHDYLNPLKAQWMEGAEVFLAAAHKTDKSLFQWKSRIAYIGIKVWWYIR